jgi:hypothetical protein
MIFVKLLYLPIGIAGGVLGARVAGAVFERTWKLAAREGDPPKATDQGHGWVEVVATATVKGAVFGGVKALVDHASATGFARVTGVWPGAKADDKVGDATGSRSPRTSRT